MCGSEVMHMCGRLGQVRLGLVRLGQVRIGQVRLGQVRLGQVRLGQVRLGQVRLGQIRLGQVRLGQVRLGQVRLGHEHLRQMKIYSLFTISIGKKLNFYILLSQKYCTSTAVRQKHVNVSSSFFEESQFEQFTPTRFTSFSLPC